MVWFSLFCPYSLGRPEAEWGPAPKRLGFDRFVLGPKKNFSELVLTSGLLKLFLGVPQKVRERRAPGGGVYPEAEPREGGWKEETTKWTGNRKHIGACSGVSEVRVCGRTVAGMPFACANQQEWKGRLVAMERSPWGRAFGGGDLRKWPVGCRMGGARFVLGVHARMTRPGPDGVLGELGGRAAGNSQGCRRIGSFVLCAPASESGRSLGPTVCDGD